MGGTFFIFAAAVSASVTPVTFRDHVRVTAPRIMLGDVADLGTLPTELRARAERLVLSASPDWRQERRFDKRFLASRARSLVPALKPWFSEVYSGGIRVQRLSAPQTELTAGRSGVGAVEAGNPVIARVAVGPFSVEREGTAVQPGAPGERFFLRTRDGQILAARCCGDR